MNDIKFEGNESILVTLERTSGLDSRIILTPADARINIIEDECKYMDMSVNVPLKSYCNVCVPLLCLNVY